VFLVSADDEAVLVAVAAKGAKVGMMLYEVRRAAEAVAEALRSGDADVAVAPVETVEAPHLQAVATPVPEPVTAVVPEPAVPYAASATDPAWVAHLPNGAPSASVDPQTWS
jgi:hypothetical protein